MKAADLDALAEVIADVLEVHERKRSMSLEAVHSQLLALEARTPERGAPGAETAAWRPGIYRDGVTVQHHIGQFYRALRDTASEPPGDDWERLGTAGFRFVGGHVEGKMYALGDLVVNDYSMFVQTTAGMQLMAARGAKGDPGKDGRDGSSVTGMRLMGSRLQLTLRDGAATRTIEVDFLPLLETFGEAVRESLLPR